MAWGKHFIIETEDTDNNDLPNIVMDDATNMYEEPIGTDYGGSVDCKWGEQIQTSDCQEERDKYHKENNRTCFFSEVAKKLSDHRWKEVGEAYMKELTGTIKKIRKSKKKFNRKLSRPWNVKAFEKLRQEANEDEHVFVFLEELEWEYRQEIRKIGKMMKSEYRQYPITGGHARIVNLGKRELCRHIKSTIKRFEQAKNEYCPCKYQFTYDECPELELCPIIFKDPIFVNPVEKRCEYYLWTRWGEWSACDKECEESGRIKRKRKCINACSKDEGEGKCPASTPTPTKPALTDTDETKCTPCPAEAV